ncbi:hypothetical protein DFH29DRAFT_871558 [Suillus ampliporus]|nr:hypothetical protein DFH29DRAFT_871558 [Suillus ampliporus]
MSIVELGTFDGSNQVHNHGQAVPPAPGCASRSTRAIDGWFWIEVANEGAWTIGSTEANSYQYFKIDKCHTGTGAHQVYGTSSALSELRIWVLDPVPQIIFFAFLPPSHRWYLNPNASTQVKRHSFSLIFACVKPVFDKQDEVAQLQDFLFASLPPLPESGVEPAIDDRLSSQYDLGEDGDTAGLAVLIFPELPEEQHPDAVNLQEGAEAGAQPHVKRLNLTTMIIVRSLALLDCVGSLSQQDLTMLLARKLTFKTK